MHAAVLFERGEIEETVARLGSEISRDHPDGCLLVGVLKGSMVFVSDLVRAIDVDVSVDFMAISRYAPDSGRVRIVKDLDEAIDGRDVVLVEGIVDTGLASTYLLRQLGERGPRNLRLCALLDRVRRRIVPVEIAYRGFEIDDEFVLGYGLDFAERYRNLHDIVIGDLRALQADPDTHAGALYSPSSGDADGGSDGDSAED